MFALKYKICELDEIAESGSKEFQLSTEAGLQDAFLISHNQNLYAYVNQCPHTGVNLNWQAEQFFSLDGAYIQCSLHGALFIPDTGECVRGPCLGQNLKPLQIFINNNGVYHDN